MNKIISERGCLPEIALRKAKQEIHRLGFDYQLSYVGNTVRTYQCLLKKENEIITGGNGKGLGKQSEVSSFYEALEHYYTEYELTQKPEINRIQLVQLTSQPDFSIEKPINILLNKYPQEYISCFKYEKIDEKKYLYYPVFLSKPNQANSYDSLSLIDYGSVVKYSTNSGTAIGTTIEESLIHSINELIERDAFSLFLIKTFLSLKDYPIRIIDRKTIKKDKEVLIKKIELLTNSKIVILDITTEFGIPVYGSILTGKGYPIQLIGLGASLDSEYAMERSILESLQLFHLYDDTLLREDLDILKKYERSQRYFNCVSCNIDKLIDEKRYVLVDYSKKTASENLTEYLKTLKLSIKNQGYNIYYRSLAPIESSLSCIQTIIPGLERFNIVRTGRSVLPSKRGMQFA